MKSSGVAREEIFLVTKLWPTVYEKETAIDETLARLDTDYIDLLFLHQPTDNWREGYKNIEKAYKEGKVKECFPASKLAPNYKCRTNWITFYK